MNPNDRYQLAKSLAKQPSEATARRLVAMLSDDGTFELDDAVWLYDRPATVVKVAVGAWESLVTMVDVAWPVLAEALPTATPEVAAMLVTAFGQMSAERRSALPASVHDAIVEASQASSSVRHTLEANTFERDFARRVQAHELATPEAFWRARLEHPDWTARTEATTRLAEVVQDKEGFALELVARLRLADRDQPVVDELARLPITPAVIDAARPVIARCVAMLAHTPIGNYIPWQPSSMTDDLNWRFAAAVLRLFADHVTGVRPVLVDRLLATNEVGSLAGSLRSRLIEALGDRARLLAEISARLADLEASADVVEANRGKQLRALLV